MQGRIAGMVVALTALAATAVRADDTGLASMHAFIKIGGKTCFDGHRHSGSGEGATKDKARAAAIKAWWEYTAGEYGSDWAHWGRSAAQKVSYGKAATGWSATVESTPCK